jgi:Outer membrane receptor proteins, mostly Fe transport
MKKSIILLITILFNINAIAYASDDKAKGFVIGVDGQPIVNAFVYWENADETVLTDPRGYFEINIPAGDGNTLCAGMTGYETVCREIADYNNPIQITMDENAILDAVEVVMSSPGRLKDRVEIVQRETLSTRELSRAACCNLSESFETNPSVDITYSDAVTGAKQIQLLGLAGTYVQMLTENFPNMRGVSAPYGMDYIPGPWMQSIQISKGAASVKNGYESVTGQINIEYKKPHVADPLSVNLFVGDAGRYEANADGMWKINDKLATGLLAHYSIENNEHDSNDDTFLDMPKKQQINLMNRWHYQTEKYITQSGVKLIKDDRKSGQTKHTLKDKYDYNPYKIEINTLRGELFTKHGFVIDNDDVESVALIASATWHEQQSTYAEKQYNVIQKNLYLSLMYETNFGDSHKISTGLSMNLDDYRQTGNIAQLYRNLQPDNEMTTGYYAEYTYTPADKFSLLAGVRADYSTLHHWFVTPRIHVKYDVADWLHLRASAGLGHRTAFVLSDNSYLMASSRALRVADNLKQETAWNTGLSASLYIPINNKEWTISAEWYYTRFNNQVVIDLDSNPHEVAFYNLDGRSDSQVFQLEMSYPFFRGFTLLGAYRWMNPKVTYNGKLMDKSLVSKYKGLLTAMYETKLRRWQFDLTGQFNGGGRMPTPDANNPLWSETFKPYTIVHAQITRNFRNWAVYIGGENLTNFKQNHPIISAEDPYGADFDATMVWGPTHGRKIYIGMRYTLFN